MIKFTSPTNIVIRHTFCKTEVQLIDNGNNDISYCPLCRHDVPEDEEELFKIPYVKPDKKEERW